MVRFSFVSSVQFPFPTVILLRRRTVQVDAESLGLSSFPFTENRAAPSPYSVVQCQWKSLSFDTASSLVNSGGCLSLSGFGRLGCSVSVFEVSHLGLSISTDGKALLGSSLSVDGSRSGRHGRSNTTDCSRNRYFCLRRWLSRQLTFC